MKSFLIAAGIFILAVACAIGYANFYKIDLSGRSLFSSADEYLSALIMKQGKTNLLGTYLDAHAGACVAASNSFTVTRNVRERIHTRNFPFSRPVIASGTVGFLWGPAATREWQIKCQDSLGRVLRINGSSFGPFIIERMLNAPFRIIPMGSGELAVEGNGLDFLWRSPRGDLKIQAEGPARIKGFIFQSDAQAVEDYWLTVEEGKVAVTIESTFSAKQDKALGLRAEGSGTLLWGDSRELVTENNPAVALPSGFARPNPPK